MCLCVGVGGREGGHEGVKVWEILVLTHKDAAVLIPSDVLTFLCAQSASTISTIYRIKGMFSFRLL